LRLCDWAALTLIGFPMTVEKISMLLAAGQSQ
jgi:hypothetical protein